jgi:hypothetical protein
MADGTTADSLSVLGLALGESEMFDLFHIARSFAESRSPWLLSPPNKALATAPFPSGMVGRFPEAQSGRTTSVDPTEARCHSGTPGGLPGRVRPSSF